MEDLNRYGFIKTLDCSELIIEGESRKDMKVIGFDLIGNRRAIMVDAKGKLWYLNAEGWGKH